MRFTFLCTMLLILTWLLSGCEKIELPDADDGGNSGAVVPEMPDEDADFLTVSEAMSAADDDYIVVQGYIVGYVDGTTISEKSVVLAVPTDKPNTNMLIADSPDETNLAQMMPIGLPESKAGVYVRSELNLYDNPTLLHKCIRIQGFVETYFRRIGIKAPSAYWLVSEGEEEEEETPMPTDSCATPGISHDAELIEGGR